MTPLQYRPLRLVLAAALATSAATAQSQSGDSAAVRVEIPADIPLQVLSVDFENSDFQPRGGALVIELEGSIQFRHEGGSVVRAITLAVVAHRRLLGGRAVVAVPSLHVARGETFQVHLSLRIARPLPVPPGPVVQISPDAVLFDTLAAAGPDRLDSVRKMTIRELEARRDREYFLGQLGGGGLQALVSAMQASLRRQAARPRLEVRFAGDGPATAATEADPRELQLAFVQEGGEPLLLEQGSALIIGLISDAPRIRLRNVSAQPVRYFELGWLVRDNRGIVYSVGAAPVERAPLLKPGEYFETGASRRFAFRPRWANEPPALVAMSAYLRSAQLDDGSVWIPSRSALAASELLDVVPVSSEEHRLTLLYRERGPAAVAAELRKLAGNPAHVPSP